MSNTKVTTTLQVNNSDVHPLNVTVILNAQFEEGGWTWEVERITYVELVVGDKEGIDITRQILHNPRAAALLTSCAADCETQIYNALAERRAA